MGLTFLDLFAGVGGFRLGMEAAGHTCAGWVEIDKFARDSYKAIHNTEGEWLKYNVRNVSDKLIRKLRRKRGPIHVITGGFPCQAFSIAGKRGGFNDTRGTLFFEIARFASILRPSYLFLENVPGFLNHNNGNTFETILRTLDEIGYDAEWEVLNSKDFGVPQHRERVFIIGHLRGARTRKVFPITGQGNEYSTVGKPTKTAIARTYTAGGNSAGNHSGMTILIEGLLEGKGHEQNRRVYNPKGLAPTLMTGGGGNQEPKIIEPIPVLTPDRPEKRQNGRRFKEPGEEMFTLTAQDRHGVMINDQPEVWDMYNKRKRTDGNVGTLTANGNTSFTKSGTFGISNGYRIRKLTPRECWRLQGFPDWAFNKAAQVNSDSQLYKQAGNSVTVQVIQAIAERLEVF